jgi:hypothetical protein
MLRDIVCDAGMAVLDYVMENGTECSGADLGLDPRALHRGWVTAGAIVLHKIHDRSLQYYGGFEYVDSNAREEVGSYVIYWRHEDERVDGAIECFEEKMAEEA